MHRRGTEFGVFLQQEFFSLRPRRLRGEIFEFVFTTKTQSSQSWEHFWAKIFFLRVLRAFVVSPTAVGGRLLERFERFEPAAS
jgi:hypothetical protein